MQKAAIPPEVASLREEYASSISKKTILDDFARRTNNQRITKVEQIQNRLRGAGVKRWEVIALFRKLQALGYGAFIEGRKGHPSRFEWLASLIDVGKASQGSEDSINPVPSDATIDNGSDEMRKYTFPLRTDRDVIFELPANFTQKEAERFSAFLKTLALPD